MMLLFVSFLLLVTTVTISAELRGTQAQASQNHHREQKEQTPASLTGFRWINPITNEPYGKDGAEMLSLSSNNVMDLGEAPKGLTIEAMTTGTPIGSVQFKLESVSGATITVDNKGAAGRWFLCRNNGNDILPCNNIVDSPSQLTATAYSEKEGTGKVLFEHSVRIDFFRRGPPTLKLTMINPAAASLVRGKVESLLTNGMTIYSTPSTAISVRLDFETYKQWEPQSVVFNYDNRTILTTENYPPFALLGNKGTNYTTFSPKVGNHKLIAIAYSKRSAKGQSAKITVTFNVAKAL